MAIEATGSRYYAKTGLIITVACLFFGVYFLYDGWWNKEFQEEHKNSETGEPDVSLKVNRVYGPVICGIAAVYFLVTSLQLRSKKITADENGLTTASGKLIAYNAIRKIDKRDFERGGHFIIEYEEDTVSKTLKFSDRKYDNLGLLLDEIVRQTGAVSEDTVAEELS